jgi:salicylate hydroxylase
MARLITTYTLSARLGRHNPALTSSQRADFHRMVYELAEPHPRITIRTGCRVVSMDPSAPTLTLESGEVVCADLVIGADGVKSTTRQYVVGAPDKANPTGDAAYRAIIPADLLLKDPDLRPLVETPEMVGWMGPGGHIMTYNIVRHFLASIPDQQPPFPFPKIDN